jgi:hypothetical protein
LFESESGGAPAYVLGALDDGAPAFVAARQGQGRLFVFASSVDRDWCDLPIRTAFLPLMQRIAAWLTGTLDERETVRARVGETVSLTPESGQSPAFARAPSGVEVPLTPAPEASAVTGGPLPEPGRYEVVDAKGRVLDSLAFAATLDAAASDLSRHSVEALAGWFGEDAVKTAGGGGERAKTPVWTWLIVLAVVAFFFEGVLLRK